MYVECVLLDLDVGKKRDGSELPRFELSWQKLERILPEIVPTDKLSSIIHILIFFRDAVSLNCSKNPDAFESFEIPTCPVISICNSTFQG